MIRVKSIPALFFIAPILLFAFPGCSANVRIDPALQNKKISRLALLPLEDQANLSPGRKNFFERALSAELSNRGYFLLEQPLVNKICPELPCENQSQLIREHNLDALVSLQINSAERSNFGLGYYNNLEGNLSLKNAANSSLYVAEHSESERGGLLFNSGQVLQGLQETVDNSGDEAFFRLASVFLRALVEKLPAANAQSENSPAPTVSSASIKKLPNRAFEVCAESADTTHKHQASLVYGSLKTNLRPTTPGKFCGRYSIDIRQFPLSVELRSAFGSSDREELEYTRTRVCSLDGKAELSELLDGQTISLECLPISPQGNTCEDESSLTECSVDRVLVYRAESPTGPFYPAGQLRQSPWRIPERHAKQTYYLFSLTRDGEASAPVPLATTVVEGQEW